MKIFKKESGNVLIFTAVAMMCMMGFAALSVDVGFFLTGRTQLQADVDAAALAGASGLLWGTTVASDRAIHFAQLNKCINDPVYISSADVTFPNSGVIRVQANRPVPTFFARVAGVDNVSISATATARIGKLIGTYGMAPLCVPDLNYVLGDQVVIKAGDQDAPSTVSSFFYPVDFPPMNRGNPISGADEYEENLVYGSDSYVAIGDELLVEPGEMVGPTGKGVAEILNRDPGAYWNGTNVAGSPYPGFSSPRILVIPFFDKDAGIVPGRNSLIVVRLGAFFVEGMTGKNVYGRFIKITAPGTWGSGNSDLYAIKLVE